MASADPGSAPVPPGSVIGRAFSLLDAFLPGEEEVGLAELSRRTRLPKSTVFRLLDELARWGAVERTPGGARLGLRLFELGQAVPRQRRLREAAAPFLADLHESTRETVHLAVPHGSDVLYVQKLEGRRGPAVASRVGGRMPMYCTGVGKVLLAYGPPDRLDGVIRAGLRRRTPRTIVAPGLLHRELTRVRERGLATEREESSLGTACVAVPVVGPDGAVAAAVSVTGWAHRLRSEHLAVAVHRAAAGLSRDLSAREGAGPIH